MPDWQPFKVLPSGERPPAPRSARTVEGVGDRLRAAAFAEVQARAAFLWAAEHLAGAPPDLRRSWRALASEEEKHLGWLLQRMEQLGIEVSDRPVSDQLWHSLVACKSPRRFAVWMAGAEERGRAAGERLGQQLAQDDPESARLFARIAQEEKAHIALAARFFPEAKASDQERP